MWTYLPIYFPTLGMYLSLALQTLGSCHGGNSRSSGLSTSTQRESWHWYLSNFWVSAFTLILASVVFFCVISAMQLNIYFFLIQHFSHLYWQGLSGYLVYNSARNRSWL